MTDPYPPQPHWDPNATPAYGNPPVPLAPTPPKRRWLRLTLIISAGFLTLCCIGSVVLATIFPAPKDQGSNTNAAGADVSAAADHGGLPATAAARPTATPTPPAAPTMTSAPTTPAAPKTIAPPTTTKPAVIKSTTKPPVTHTTTKPPPNLCGAPQNPWGYTFCGGSAIYSPAASFCSYFNCIASFAKGNGYVEECGDHTYSKSGGISGSCSSHQGNLAELYEP